MHISLAIMCCLFFCCLSFFFFFKQKTAYEMRISDWSSDVCSSDLDTSHPRPRQGLNARGTWRWTPPRGDRQNAKFHTATGSHLSYREGRFWQPDVTVDTVVVDGGRLLYVEERATGSVVINQPAGHLEPDASLEQAALREHREETRS